MWVVYLPFPCSKYLQSFDALVPSANRTINLLIGFSYYVFTSCAAESNCYMDGFIDVKPHNGSILIKFLLHHEDDFNQVKLIS